MIPNILNTIVGLLFLYFQPESPRFLVSMKRFDEARVAFNRIAKVNGLGDNFAANFIFTKEQHEVNLLL